MTLVFRCERWARLFSPVICPRSGRIHVSSYCTSTPGATRETTPSRCVFLLISKVVSADKSTIASSIFPCALPCLIKVSHSSGADNVSYWLLFRIMASASWREIAKGACVRKKSSTISEVRISMCLSTGPPIFTTSIANPSLSWRFRKKPEYLEWEFEIGKFWGIASGVEARNWSCNLSL
jgi:hypothetical protein